jgi:hypothetical protein
VKLIVKALNVLQGNQQLGEEANRTIVPLSEKLIPQLINQIFQDLTIKQRNTLMETLVTHLDLKLTPAFDSLNLLLDSQIKQKNCSMEFLAFLPAFVLPVIKSIQD